MPIKEETQNQTEQRKNMEQIDTPEKILPLLNANYENHLARIDSLSEKKAVRKDKIASNEAKVDKLNAKAERLKNTNEMLKAAFGEKSIISAFIAKNEAKIDKIINNSIPKREAKIEKHKAAINKIEHKIAVSKCKSEKIKALSGIIKSFTVINPSERRKLFSESLNNLHKASKKALDFKLEKCEARLEKLNNAYISTNSAIEKHKLSQSISKLNERKNNLSERINKLSEATVPFTEQPDIMVDGMIENTRTQLDNSENLENVSSVAENICVNNAEYMENAEINLEDDLNMIDGIIDNGVKANQTVEYTKDERIKINPEYYNDMPKSDRHIEVFQIEQGKKIIDGLTAAGIAFSAVSRNEGRVAVTVNKSDIPKLKDLVNKTVTANIQPKRETAKAEQSKAVNTDYYKSLTKADRFIVVEPKGVADKIIKQLEEKNIPYSSVERKGGVKAITVSKKNESVFKACAVSAKKEHQKQIINPDFYKSLSKEERYTKRMPQEKAQETIDKLAQKGIPHSAVLDGDKSAVTIKMVNHQRGTFSMNQLKQESSSLRSSERKEKTDKTKKQEQAL